MRVAYVLGSTNARKTLRDMIVPQMESGEHIAEVVALFFTFDTTFMLLKDTDLGKRLQKLSDDNGMMIVACDQCVIEREIDDKLIDAAHIGCFPVVYGALKNTNLDQIISI